MLSQERVIEIVRTKGPVIPSQVAKIVGTDIIFASAALSELVHGKKLFLTSTKVGSTPVYYAKGQESRLQELYEYLNEKDQRAFDLLKEKRITRDDELEPLMRVAMRNIKDFAVPLQISTNGERILFWKWYMLGNDEAEVLIKSHLGKEDEEKRKAEEKQKRQEEEKKKAEEQRKIEEQKRKEAEEKAAKEKEEAELREKRRQEEEKKKLGEKKRIERERVEQEKREQEKQKRQEEKRKSEQEKREQEEQKRKEAEEKEENQNQNQKSIEPLKADTGDEFFNHIIKYFNKKKIEVIEHKVIRKKSEIDMIVRLPSVVGNLEYYCKAKNKKKVNDGDLSSAFVQGQMKKIPVLFLMTGEMTKKAKELLSTEFNKGLVVKKI
ncbi:hypothetical protein GF336_06785 [Candidatus Woesearchaeota archaeon]|nr:hypothetical protein [Candidatus Woesearchaeota archaeon]